jgi:hypothetical protein
MLILIYQTTRRHSQKILNLIFVAMRISHLMYDTLVLRQMRSVVFWVVTLCSSEKARRFGRTPHQKQAVSWAHLSAYFRWILPWLTLRPWRWWRYVPPKRRSLSEEYGVTTQIVPSQSKPWESQLHDKETFALDAIHNTSLMKFDFMI